MGRRTDREQDGRTRVTRRAARAGRAALLLIALGAIAGACTPAAFAAQADAPRDVLFVFDTTGSMGGPLASATAQAQQVMASLRANLGTDVAFGLGEVRDYGNLYSFGGEVPWHLVQPITLDTNLVQTGLGSLIASGGGDGPEAYGRGLWEANHDPAVAWRAGAKRLVVVIADNVPHDDDLNGSLPPALRRAGGWRTGQDPGVDGVVGTADDLDWEGVVLPDLKASALPIAMVLIQTPAYLPHWRYWAGLTGGTAVPSGPDVPVAIVAAARGAVSRGFIDVIEAFLARSARTRKQLGAALTAAVGCSASPRATARVVRRVIAARRLMLRQLAALDKPTPQAVQIATRLSTALTHSLAADRQYLAWLNSSTGCTGRSSAALAAAQRQDALASAAKRAFAALFNPLALSLGLRTWSARSF